MTKIEILKNTKGYNSSCTNCGKRQPGTNPQPLLVYYKEEGRRGSYYPVCCGQCAEELKEDFEN